MRRKTTQLMSLQVTSPNSTTTTTVGMTDGCGATLKNACGDDRDDGNASRS
ncbi:hypothetical protein SETIT_4G166300v2 [Setaria italica]|uniref:Uncharacterized protein n=1 Tax=Setaria italica TaxID=4555 RepID=A0A368QV09_SETIT|nr:hypothetical protein SETIT_4G166300v2 [Setaria italica]